MITMILFFIMGFLVGVGITANVMEIIRKREEDRRRQALEEWDEVLSDMERMEAENERS